MFGLPDTATAEDIEAAFARLLPACEQSHRKSEAENEEAGLRGAQLHLALGGLKRKFDERYRRLYGNQQDLDDLKSYAGCGLVIAIIVGFVALLVATHKPVNDRPGEEGDPYSNMRGR